MRVLVACEFSGVVRNAFSARGHDAMSCDLLPSDTTGKHYQGDVLDILRGGFDLIIAHPPCTYLANSGVSWLHKNPSRWDDMRKGAEFFRRILDAPALRIAVENPIMHRYAKRIIGRGQDQVVHPWMFGHPEQKATCLWLKGLPNLKPTHDVKQEMLDRPKSERERLHYLPPSEGRWKLRSMTYTGLAEAMAEQWT